MHALVTGCAGFIGSHLTEALLTAGWQVTGVDAFTENYPRAVKEANLAGVCRHPRFRLVAGDLATGPAASWLEGVTHVFHLAGEPGVRGSWGERFPVYLERNVLTTQRLLEAAEGRPLARFVLASSSSVYGAAEGFPTPETARPRPVSPYGVTKLAAEELALAYGRERGVPVVVLRLFTAYGPRQRPDLAFHRFLRAALAGGAVEVYGDGLQARDFTYVSDIVSAMRLAAAAPVQGEVLNVGTGRPVTIREALDLIEELTGRPLAVEYRPRAAGDARRTAADTARIRALLGFSPRVSLREGLRLQLESMRA